MQGDRLLTTSEVARLFRVDSKTVMRWAKAGQVKSIRTPGGHWRFPSADILALLRVNGAEHAADGDA
jgi:excisionase family DNA binding protein